MFKALVVLDVYKAHQTSDAVDGLKEAGFECFAPGNCTLELHVGTSVFGCSSKFLL